MTRKTIPNHVKFKIMIEIHKAKSTGKRIIIGTRKFGLTLPAPKSRLEAAKISRMPKVMMITRMAIIFSRSPASIFMVKSLSLSKSLSNSMYSPEPFTTLFHPGSWMSVVKHMSPREPKHPRLKPQMRMTIPKMNAPVFRGQQPQNLSTLIILFFCSRLVTPVNREITVTLIGRFLKEVFVYSLLDLL